MLKGASSKTEKARCGIGLGSSSGDAPREDEANFESRKEEEVRTPTVKPPATASETSSRNSSEEAPEEEAVPQDPQLEKLEKPDLTQSRAPP